MKIDYLVSIVVLNLEKAFQNILYCNLYFCEIGGLDNSQQLFIKQFPRILVKNGSTERFFVPILLLIPGKPKCLQAVCSKMKIDSKFHQNETSFSKMCISIFICAI